MARTYVRDPKGPERCEAHLDEPTAYRSLVSSKHFWILRTGWEAEKPGREKLLEIREGERAYVTQQDWEAKTGSSVGQSSWDWRCWGPRSRQQRLTSPSRLVLVKLCRTWKQEATQEAATKAAKCLVALWLWAGVGLKYSAKGPGELIMLLLSPVCCLSFALHIYTLSWSLWTSITKYLRLGNFWTMQIYYS